MSGAKREASVWRDGSLVGSLTSHDGRIVLRYAEGWLQSGPPISQSLPVSSDAVDAQAFFAGLLPEGRARERLLRQLRLDDDDFTLLVAIGHDCAGALSVLPEGQEPLDEPPTAISDEELSLLISSQGQILPSSSRPRFSLAGAQDKLAVIVDDGSMWLPTQMHPSSHILKFETIKWVCFAEHAAHQLARRLGLPVPATEYREIEATPHLLIERYDRERDDRGNLRRLHQEDVAQALGYHPSRKYEDDGGPGLAEIATLLRGCSADPVSDILLLRDWQMFNYLVGNYDAHAKNLALLYPHTGSVPRLAPFYDLVCIELLDRIGIHFAREMALRIGESAIPERIGRADWHRFAAAIGIPKRRAIQRLLEMASALPALASTVRADFASEHGDNQVYDRFEECIADRCAWTQRQME